MGRSAPGVERAVAVLAVMAAHPRDGFTLTELARRTALNKSTCHAVLASLVDAGYVVRHPSTPSYRLGPALIALGHAAEQGFPALEFARDAMRAVSEQVGAECLATAVAGDEIVVLARAGTPAPLGVSIQPGQRLPLAPPLGSVFLAWAGAPAVDDWLARVRPVPPAAERARYLAALAAVRRRGYAVGLEAEARERLGRALARLADGAEPAPSLAQVLADLGHEEYFLLDREASPAARVNHIAAPVFDPAGAVVLALTLVGFPHQLGAAEVPAHAGALCAAADTVTRAVRGHRPAEPPEDACPPA